VTKNARRGRQHAIGQLLGIREKASDRSSGQGVDPPIRQGSGAGLHSLARPAFEDDRIESQAPAISMQREDHHEHQQEEVGPWPLALGVVQTQPQIQDLERTDPTQRRTKMPRMSDIAVSTSSA